MPDTREVGVGALSRGDFLVVACDGLWDVVSHQQVGGGAGGEGVLVRCSHMFAWPGGR